MKNTLQSCKQQCKDTLAAGGTLRDCVSSCRADFAATKAACRDDLKACRDACVPTLGTCELDCGKDLAKCVSDLRNGACASGCAASAKTAGAACQTAPNRLQCILGVASTLGQCLGGCADELRAGTDGCLSAAASCKSACNGTGLASGAFIMDGAGSREPRREPG
ncbi:MAG: hypothetical protein ACKOCT_16140, partial [Alphaproteobacteria bacterium]